MGAAAFAKAFAAHLDNTTTPYLSLSSQVPSLCAILSQVQDQNPMSVGHAFEQCANLIHHVERSSPFGDDLPERPKHMSRQRFVREMCSYAGLCLDLVRLDMVQRQEGDKRLSPEMNATLRSAGKYLSAMQMDMTRLKDDAAPASASHTSAARTVAERATQAAENGATEAAGAVLIDEAAAAELPRAATVALVSACVVALPKQPSEYRDEVGADDTMIANGSACAADSRAAVDLASDFAENDDASNLLTPTFGEFMDKQLIPLYIADIPFKYLAYLSDEFCGVPLDSDDEQRALKFLGRPHVAPSTANHRPRKKRRTSSASAPSNRPRLSRGPARTPVLGTTLSGLLRGERKSHLRSQMVTSVAEKRRKGCSAARDMNFDPRHLRALRPSRTCSRASFAVVSTSSQRHDSLHREAASTKALVIKPSIALFSSPTPARLELASAASPLSTQVVSVQGLESTSKRQLEPEWDLLDTPRRC